MADDGGCPGVSFRNHGEPSTTAMAMHEFSAVACWEQQIGQESAVFNRQGTGATALSAVALRGFRDGSRAGDRIRARGAGVGVGFPVELGRAAGLSRCLGVCPSNQ